MLPEDLLRSWTDRTTRSVVLPFVSRWRTVASVAVVATSIVLVAAVTRAAMPATEVSQATVDTSARADALPIGAIGSELEGWRFEGPPLQPVADHGTMTSTGDMYIARAVADAQREGGEIRSTAAGSIRDERPAGMRTRLPHGEKQPLGAPVGQGSGSLGSSAQGIAIEERSALANESLANDAGSSSSSALADDPTDIAAWRSFDMASAGYLASNGAIAVGPDAVLSAVNGQLRAWDKTGSPLMEPMDLTDRFEPIIEQLEDEFGLSVHVVSPRAAYSDYHERFIITAVGLPVDGVDAPVLLVAVSHSEDPTGGYCIARIAPTTTDDPSGLGIHNYSMSVNDHALTVGLTLVQRRPDGGADYYAVRAYVEELEPLALCMERSGLLYNVYLDDDLANFNSLHAADTLGLGETAVFVGAHERQGQWLQPLVMEWDEEGVPGGLQPIVPIGVPPYIFPPDATQAGSSTLISTGFAYVRSAVYLGPEELWTAQTVNVAGSAGVAWFRLTMAGELADGGTVHMDGGNHLYNAQIMPSISCEEAAMVAFNHSGTGTAVGASIMRLGSGNMVPIAQGQGCVSMFGYRFTPWDRRVPIAYDFYDDLFWLQPSVADGGAADCSANQWATHVVRVAWDLCLGGEPEPTLEPSPGPSVTPSPTTRPPDGQRKGIGFALGSKRFMRDVHGPSGPIQRSGAMRGPALTGIQVQNIDGVRTANPAIEFAEQRLPYGPPPANLFVRTIEMDTIPPGASLNSYIPSLDLLDAMYRVTITTPRDGGDLSAILRTDWDTGGAAIVSNLWNASRVVLPRLVRNAYSHSSVIAVTNAELEPTNVTMRFYRDGSSAVASTKQFQLLPAEALTFDLNDADAAFDALGDGFVGTAILETDGNMVGAQIYEYAQNSELAIGGYEGIPALQASSRLFVPLFRHQQRGPGGIRLDTAIVVANAGEGPTDVTITYRTTTNTSASAACRGAGVIQQGPVTIAPSTSHTFYQGPGGGHGIPDDCFGSAVVDGSGAGAQLVATAIDAQNGNEQLSMINATPFESASNKFALPLFRSRHLVAEFTTGIQVMNTSAQAANVNIAFSRSEGNTTFPITGCRGQCDVVIQPYEAHTWWPPAIDAIPSGTYGAAVIESDQPIVVLVNDYPLRGGSDMATYAGIPVLIDPAAAE